MHADSASPHLQGYGFAVNCSSSTSKFNATAGTTGSIKGVTLFEANTSDTTGATTVDEWGGYLQITTLWKETPDCSGTLNMRTCDLYAGITKYPVNIQGNVVTTQGTWRNDEFLERR